MVSVKINPYVFIVSFDCYGDIDEVCDSRTGDDVQHLFSKETLNLIESTAREADAKRVADAKFDYAIDSLEYT